MGFGFWVLGLGFWVLGFRGIGFIWLTAQESFELIVWIACRVFLGVMAVLGSPLWLGFFAAIAAKT